MFRKNKIVLDFYTARSDVYDYAPIKKAIKFFPDWWKELPRTVRYDDKLADRPTMKSCEGFLDLYKTGFVHPLWTDLAVLVGKKGTDNYKYQFSDEVSSLTVHPSAQRGAGFHPNDFLHLKLNSPWVCRCEEDVKFVVMQSSWNFPTVTRPVIPPAIIDFKHQSGLNINMFIERRDEDLEHLLGAGQPMLHCIPLDNRDIELRLHLVSTDEYLRHYKRAPSLKFTGKYRYIKKLLSKDKGETE